MEKMSGIESDAFSIPQDINSEILLSQAMKGFADTRDQINNNVGISPWNARLQMGKPTKQQFYWSLSPIYSYTVYSYVDLNSLLGPATGTGSEGYPSILLG